MFKSLQVCRVFAGVLITLFHLGGAFASEKYFGAKVLGRALSFGHYSVVFFFVLSGFLIVWMHLDDIGRPQRLLSYIRKRLMRILPAYWIVFMGIYLLALQVPSLSRTVPHDFWIILKSLLLLPQDPSVMGGTGAPVLIVVWSLQYEMFFYAAVACFIVNRWLGWSLVALMLVNFVACKVEASCGFPRSFVGSNYILPFCFGVITALLARSSLLIRDPLRMTAAVISILCLLRGLEVVLDISVVVLPDGAVIYGLLSAALLLSLVIAEQQGKIRLPNYWNTLAGASYALFLLHFPMISILCKFALVLGVDSGLEIAVAFVVILTACLGSALAFHLWLERPLLGWLSGKWRSPHLAVSGAR